MNDSEGTFERETSALVKLQDRIKTKRNIIVTYEGEGIIEREGFKIEVVPACKFIIPHSFDSGTVSYYDLSTTAPDLLWPYGTMVRKPPVPPVILSNFDQF